MSDEPKCGDPQFDDDPGDEINSSTFHFRAYVDCHPINSASFLGEPGTWRLARSTVKAPWWRRFLGWFGLPVAYEVTHTFEHRPEGWEDSP